MKKYFKTFLLIFFLVTLQNNSYADIPHYIDFKFILNNSVAGKKAQTELKKNYEKNINALMQKEKKIQEEEKKIIHQKKVLSQDEYKNQVEKLRSKVSSLQKERGSVLRNLDKKRTKAKNELLKNLNPIIKEYMQEKKIRIVLDKKSLLLADENLDITNDIMSLLNKKLKSIKLN